MCIHCKLPIWAALAVVSMSAMVATAYPQEPKSAGPRVEIVDFGWSADRQLVVGVRITASKSQPLALGKDAENPDEGVTLFTTKESWLIDIRTGGKIPASRKFPNQPNFGWIKTVQTLPPGESETFTAAFPTPPLPPIVKGKREDYRLSLHLPGDLPPVEFIVPCPSDPAESSTR